MNTTLSSEWFWVWKMFSSFWTLRFIIEGRDRRKKMPFSHITRRPCWEVGVVEVDMPRSGEEMHAPMELPCCSENRRDFFLKFRLWFGESWQQLRFDSTLFEMAQKFRQSLRWEIIRIDWLLRFRRKTDWGCDFRFFGRSSRRHFWRVSKTKAH